MTDELRYEHLSEKSFAVFGNKELHGKAIRDIGGTWNPRLKPIPGWFINKKEEENLKKVIESFKNQPSVPEVKQVVSEVKQVVPEVKQVVPEVKQVKQTVAEKQVVPEVKVQMDEVFVDEAVSEGEWDDDDKEDDN